MSLGDGSFSKSSFDENAFEENSFYLGLLIDGKKSGYNETLSIARWRGLPRLIAIVLAIGLL